MRELVQIFVVPFLVLLLHAFLGLVVHIYILWPWFDIPMHLAGGASIGLGAVIAFRILQGRGFLQNTPLPLKLFLVVSVVALVAMLWEFAEFAGDRLLGPFFFPRLLQESLTDTMADLGFGFLGGIFTGSYMLISEKKKRRNRF